MKKNEEQILTRIEDMFSKLSQEKEKIYRDIYDKTIEGNIDLYREEFFITLSYAYVTETLFKIDVKYLTKDDIRENIKYLHINHQDLWIKFLHFAPECPQGVRALIQRAMYNRSDVFTNIPVGATVNDKTFVGCNASEEQLPAHIRYYLEIIERRIEKVKLLNKKAHDEDKDALIDAYLRILEEVNNKPLYRELYNKIKNPHFQNLLLQTIRIDLAIKVMDKTLELNEERMTIFIGILPPDVNVYCLEYASLHDVHDTFTHMKEFLNTQIENVQQWERRQENRVSLETNNVDVISQKSTNNTNSANTGHKNTNLFTTVHQNDNQETLQEMDIEFETQKLEQVKSLEVLRNSVVNILNNSQNFFLPASKTLATAKENIQMFCTEYAEKKKNLDNENPATTFKNFLESMEPPLKEIRNRAFKSFKKNLDLISSDTDKIEFCNFAKGLELFNEPLWVIGTGTRFVQGCAVYTQLVDDIEAIQLELVKKYIDTTYLF